MTYRRTDWLASWLNQKAQRDLADQALEGGVAPATLGATQVRFIDHALRGSAAKISLAAYEVMPGSGHWSIVIDDETGQVRAYPGGKPLHIPGDSLDEVMNQFEHFPDADPDLFQDLMAHAANDRQFQEFFEVLHGYPLPIERPAASWFDGSRSLEELRRAMEWHFGCDEALGVTRNDADDMVLPCGGTFSRCTNSAHLTAKEFGGAVSGFLVDDNPTVTNEAVQTVMGHDFTVINDRYVVDLWIGIYTGSPGPDGERCPCVYDLNSEDPGEQALIESIFGDRHCWKVLEDCSQSFAASQQSNGATHRGATLSIDSVPYDVKIEGDRHLAIKCCEGSILAKLNNDPVVTGNRSSDELKYCVMDTADGELRAYEVSYDGNDGGTVYSSPCDGGRPSLEEVEGWISSAYGRIESVGSLALLDEDEMESAMRQDHSLSPG